MRDDEDELMKKYEEYFDGFWIGICIMFFALCLVGIYCLADFVVRIPG